MLGTVAHKIEAPNQKGKQSTYSDAFLSYGGPLHVIL